MKTTTNKQEIEQFDPCQSGFDKFIKAHGNKTVTFSQALESNGWNDLWWLLRNIWNQLSVQQQTDLQFLLCDCAELVLPFFEEKYPDDKRPREAIRVIRDWLNGKISDDELKKYRKAAFAAAAAYDAYARVAAKRRPDIQDKMVDELKTLLTRWETV